jgi:hypothetical protein
MSPLREGRERHSPDPALGEEEILREYTNMMLMPITQLTRSANADESSPARSGEIVDVTCEGEDASESDDDEDEVMQEHGSLYEVSTRSASPQFSARTTGTGSALEETDETSSRPSAAVPPKANDICLPVRAQIATCDGGAQPDLEAVPNEELYGECIQPTMIM